MNWIKVTLVDLDNFSTKATNFSDSEAGKLAKSSQAPVLVSERYLDTR